MTQSEDNSYKGILRNMSLFGGVQIVQVIAGLLRGKIAAIFLGPAGMGIASLFTSSATTLQQLSSLGLGQSIVREIAAETKREGDSFDNESIYENKGLLEALKVSRFLLLLTGLCGAILTIILSGWLSNITFGSNQYLEGFALLSVMIFFTTLSNGEIAILQGLHRVSRLAIATLGALIIGMLAMLPFYWILGDRGIVPAMTVNAFATWGFYKWCSEKEVSVRNVPSVWNAFNLYRPIIYRMVKLGIVLVASQLLGSLTVYLINIYVREVGSNVSVGLYQSANSLTMQCVTVVFAAMGMEFFPRLTSVAEDKEKICLLVNRQIEIVALIAAPIAALMLVFAPLAVKIVLSEKFLPAVPLIRWMCLGILLKAISYPTGYISFAKGDRKTFFWLEGILGNVILLSFSILGYILWGLIGLGIASAATFLVFIGVYIVLTHRIYGYKMSHNAAGIALITSLLLTAILISSWIKSYIWSYIGMGIATMATIIFCGSRLLSLIKVKESSSEN